MGRDQVVESDTGNDSSRGKDQGHSSPQGLGDGIGTSERLLNGNHLENRASCATRMGGGGLWDRGPGANAPRGRDILGSPANTTHCITLTKHLPYGTVPVNNTGVSQQQLPGCRPIEK